MLIAARESFAAAARKRLPYDAEVEYLQSSGTQWIDTGVIGGPNARWVSDCAITDTRSVNRYIGQVGTAPKYNARFNFGRNLNDKFTGFIGDVSYSVVGQSDSARHTFVLDALLGVFSVDSMVGNFGSIAWSFPSQVYGGISLFGRMFVDTGVVNPIISMRLWSAQISQYGSIVRDMIPVRFTNEFGQSEGAMYDRANPTVGVNPDGAPRTDGLYRNRGTGSFTIGPDKTA